MLSKNSFFTWLLSSCLYHTAVLFKERLGYNFRMLNILVLWLIVYNKDFGILFFGKFLDPIHMENFIEITSSFYCVNLTLLRKNYFL